MKEKKEGHKKQKKKEKNIMKIGIIRILDPIIQNKI